MCIMTLIPRSGCGVLPRKINSQKSISYRDFPKKVLVSEKKVLVSEKLVSQKAKPFCFTKGLYIDIWCNLTVCNHTQRISLYQIAHYCSQCTYNNITLAIKQQSHFFPPTLLLFCDLYSIPIISYYHHIFTKLFCL